MMWLFLPWNKFLKSDSVITGCWGKGGGGGRRVALDSFITKEVWVHCDCAKCAYIMNMQSVCTSWICKVCGQHEYAKWVCIVTAKCMCIVTMQSVCASWLCKVCTSWLCKVCIHHECAKCVYIINVQCVCASWLCKVPQDCCWENRERRADSVNPSFSSSLMFISEIFIKAMLLALKASSLGFELKLNTWSIETNTITYQPPM